MSEQKEVIKRWESTNGIRVCLSTFHKDMHIVNHPDGKFHSITASNESMVAKYPVIKKLRTQTFYHHG